MKWAGVAAIIIMLFVSGCLQEKKAEKTPTFTEPIVTQQPQPPKEPEPVQDNVCKTGSVLENDECFSNLAKDTNNINWCDKIYSTDAKDDCILPFALVDGKLCEKLFSSAYRSECFYDYAIDSASLETCARIGNSTLKDKCLKELSPPCSFEPDEDSHLKCISIEKQDYTLCGKSTPCLLNYAKEKADASACNLIPDDEMAFKNACMALATNSPSKCEQVEQNAIVDYCYKIYAEEKDDASLCKLGRAGNEYRNQCHLGFAIKLKDETQCTGVSGEKERDYCYKGYAIATGNYSVCANIINSLTRSGCYIKTALEHGEPAACQGLGYSDMATCYNLILNSEEGVRNPESCALISSEFWRDKCYTSAAENLRDSSWCDYVQGETELSNCLSTFPS